MFLLYCLGGVLHRMDSSTRSRTRRSRAEEWSRGHARPLGEPSGPRGHVRPRAPEPELEPESIRQRMVPRSRARASRPALPIAADPALGTRHRGKRRSQVSVPSVRVRRSISLRRLFSWRLVSLAIVIGLSAVLYVFLTADAFYVRVVSIGGQQYLSGEEIFQLSDIAQKHIFWIDAKDVERRLEAVPNLADATVLIGWPPQMVQILVVEREPALIWEQQIRVWVDANGIVMKLREDRSGLVRIVVPEATEPIAVGQRIPRTILDGALQLKRRYPNIDVLLYDPIKGLGYRDGRGWSVWYGSGEDIDTKLLVYNALVAAIYPQVQPGEIMMGDPDRPYYTVLWRTTG